MYNRAGTGVGDAYYLLFIAYCSKLSADIEMKNYNIKTSIVSPEGPKVRFNKTGINLMIFSIVSKT